MDKRPVEVELSDEMWHAVCPRHGKYTYPTRLQAEEVGRAHAEDEGRPLEVRAPEEHDGLAGEPPPPGGR